MKRLLLFISFTLLSASVLQAQHRDRRAPLGPFYSYSDIRVTETGKLWMFTKKGKIIFTANDIHSSWNTVLGADIDPNNLQGGHFECLATFGDKTAIAAGYHASSKSDYVIRTTDGGKTWDTVVIDPRLGWVYTCCYRPYGQIWLGNGVLAYSADSGRTFQVIDSTIGCPTSIYMINNNSGYMGTSRNRIFSTSDNWRTKHRLPTPKDQHKTSKHDYDNTYDDSEILDIKQWNDYLIVTEKSLIGNREGEVFYTLLNDSMSWQRPPINVISYEVDSLTGALWAIDDSNRLIRLSDWNTPRRYAIKAEKIIALVDGYVYCKYDESVLRVAPDGTTDTCMFFTDERHIEKPPLIIKNGSLTWGSDYKSIYILDDLGWYRVAYHSLWLRALNPHPELRDRIVFLDEKGKNYTVDTAGKIEPYVFPQPFGEFVKSGVQEVIIETIKGGCYLSKRNKVSYIRQDDILKENYNYVSKSCHRKRKMPASEVEQALLKLGERYSVFPTPQDFGSHKKSLDLHQVFAVDDELYSTSFVSYILTFVNTAGDTVHIWNSVYRDYELIGDYHFPWLLPMVVHTPNASFVSYQPCLWQTVRKLMPRSMFLRKQLSNKTLHPRKYHSKFYLNLKEAFEMTFYY